MVKNTPKPKTALPMANASRKPGLLDLRETGDNTRQIKELEDIALFKESLSRVRGLKDNIDALIQQLDTNIQDDLASEEDTPMKNLGKLRSQFNDI